MIKNTRRGLYYITPDKKDFNDIFADKFLLRLIKLRNGKKSKAIIST